MGVIDVLRVRKLNKTLYDEKLVCPKCGATLFLEDTQEDGGKELEEYTECPICMADVLVTRLVHVTYSIEEC